jgi:predicted CoA-binding protein
MPSAVIIGASNDRSKFGNKALRAYKQRGYEVYPVNPNEAVIEEIPAFASIRDVPVSPDVVSVYVRPAILLKLLPEIAARGCKELWLNPGTESEAVLAESTRLKLKVIQACSIVALGLSLSRL